MKDSFTHITCVVDRSGSMQGVAGAAQAAINGFFNEQKSVPGECSVFFVDFDGDAPFRIVHDGDLATTPPYVLEARGMTPLLDAVARGIINTGVRLSNMPEEDRPAKVIFVIQTDGAENASKEFTWEQVAAMVKTQQDIYGWQFLFLGMGLDTFHQGNRMGVQNVVSTDASNAATFDSAYGMTANTATAYRTGAASDMGAMRGMHVNSVGRVTNEAGEEIDPKTGKPKVDIQA